MRGDPSRRSNAKSRPRTEHVSPPRPSRPEKPGWASHRHPPISSDAVRRRSAKSSVPLSGLLGESARRRRLEQRLALQNAAPAFEHWLARMRRQAKLGDRADHAIGPLPSDIGSRDAARKNIEPSISGRPARVEQLVGVVDEAGDVALPTWFGETPEKGCCAKRLCELSLLVGLRSLVVTIDQPSMFLAARSSSVSELVERRHRRASLRRSIGHNGHQRTPLAREPLAGGEKLADHGGVGVADVVERRLSPIAMRYPHL